MYRKTTGKLAELTGGRVLAIRYRLAPQNPFPAAILDTLIAYLNLLYPPPGSSHFAVPADSIVLAGDSSGGVLAIDPDNATRSSYNCATGKLLRVSC